MNKPEKALWILSLSCYFLDKGFETNFFSRSIGFFLAGAAIYCFYKVFTE